ncbi:putative glycerol-3-phosphate acyltransferase 3 [Dichanthelium oligosanthes]|uniref:Putative glycerol-3-phosphate acyltransferase 3 n=1 Tax=Dichanthelium oligosanthes TaxID=888268 RepID=A0A1E5W900_9POAL|nr:putative glycerol-3-phosphate acyltransferase 3 [Dichanthelium oligosanthes]
MSKAFVKSLSQLNKALIRRLNALIIRAQPPPARPDGRVATTTLDALPARGGGGSVAVCKVEGGLLRSSSAFPYFMLVALEAGGLLRGLFLMLLYPALLLLGHGRAIKVMAFVSFLGLKKDSFRAGRAALPRLLLEDVSAVVFDAVVASPSPSPRRRCVCVSAMPRAMVEPFLKEYLGVGADAVVAPEMREFRGRYLGVMQDEGELLRGLDVEKVIASEEKAGGSDVVVGVGGLGSSFAQLFQKHCKEVYVPTESARRRGHALPRRRYPKPLIFHDGRIAFRPTPAATLAMFMWLPLGAALAVVRIASFLILPFSLSVPLLAALGMYSRLIANSSAASTNLFACNHRSLIDPLYVAAGAGRTDLAAATYSISRLSEVLSPIPTFRLTRDRAADRAAMQAKLSRGPGGGRGSGGLVVCPEGTTCREPFLLRFSPLFAELGRDVAPVALHSSVGMFHGTTAGGWKALDPLFLLMNPVPAYIVQFLDTITSGGGGGGPEAARAAANDVQRRIAEALGYTCTGLTRRDKYLMLAGNEGLVDVDHGAKKKTASTNYN